MPDMSLIEQINMFDISGTNIKADDVLILMDVFALPYKAVVLRLVECGVITEGKAKALIEVDSDAIFVRIELTGKSEQWQRDTRRLLHYGTLLDLSLIHIYQPALPPVFRHPDLQEHSDDFQ